jgi:hypothetical protein
MQDDASERKVQSLETLSIACISNSAILDFALPVMIKQWRNMKLLLGENCFQILSKGRASTVVPTFILRIIRLSSVFEHAHGAELFGLFVRWAHLKAKYVQQYN